MLVSSVSLFFTYLIFISFPLLLFTSFISSSVLLTSLLFIASIVSPCSIPEFSYGFFFSLFSSFIWDIPTTKTPFVYSFIPIAVPSGITVVFGTTATFTSFIFISPNKLNFNFSTPASLIFCLLILLAVKTVSWFFEISDNPVAIFKFNFSPSIITIFWGIDVIAHV